MTISDKIKQYCIEKKISIAEFARSLNVTPQYLNSKLSGKSRLNAEILMIIRKKHPDIDLNRLLDEEENDYYFVQESPSDYGDSEFRKRLAADAATVIKIMERYK